MKNKDDGFLKNLIICLICVGMVITLLKDAKYLFTGETKDINQMIENGEELKVGEHVSIDVTYVVDWYAELTKRGRKTGTKVTYHAMAVLNSGEIISLSAKKDSKEYKKIDNLVDETYDYLTGVKYLEPTTVKFTGTVRKIDSKISGYYKEALTYYGYSSSEDAYMLDIDTTQDRIFGVLGIFLASFFALLFGFLAFSDVVDYKKKKAAREAALNEPISVKIDNDPIFNAAFYERNKPVNAESVSYSDSSDKNYNEDDKNTYDTAESADDVIHAKESKFSLKKD